MTKDKQTGEANKTVEAGDMSNSERWREWRLYEEKEEVGKFPAIFSCTSCQSVMSSLPYSIIHPLFRPRGGG